MIQEGVECLAKKVTMQQIADRLEISKFAVSKALSGKPGVSASTREKIVAAATQLGYFAQKKAGAALARRPGQRAAAHRTLGKTVAVLIPNIRFQSEDSMYWGKIIHGISNRLRQLERGMILITEHSADRFVGAVNPEGLSGLIGVGQIDNQLLLEVRKLDLPFVLVDHEDPLIPSDTLFVNNCDCMRRVVNYLIGLGHRSFRFVGNIRFSRSFYDRWTGFRAALEDNGIAVRMQDEDPWMRLQAPDRREMTEELARILESELAAGPLPGTFVCANDEIALCLMRVLEQRNIAVPAQCSVTGFDDIDDAAASNPGLSTVHSDKEALGRRAVETLLRRLECPNDPLEKMMINGDFVIRSSSGPAPGAG